MARSSSASYDLATRLLAFEANGHQNPAEMADAIDRICLKMYQQLGRRIGAEGYRVLVSRALYLTKEEFSFLDGVVVELQAPIHRKDYDVSGQGGTCLKGIHEYVHELDSTEVSRGVTALLANFISLLSRFVGFDLALSEVRRAYPEFPLDDAGNNPEEAKE